MTGELTATTTAARTPVTPYSIMRRFQDCGAPISVESSAMLIQSLAPRRVSAFFNYDTHDRRRALRRSAGCGGRNFEHATSSIASLSATLTSVTASLLFILFGSVRPARQRGRVFFIG